MTLGRAVLARASKVPKSVSAVTSARPSWLAVARDRSVGGAEQVPLGDVDRVVAGLDEQGGHVSGKALVDQQLHAEGRSGSVRSSTAAAANRSASRTSSSSSWG